VAHNDDRTIRVRDGNKAEERIVAVLYATVAAP